MPVRACDGRPQNTHKMLNGTDALNKIKTPHIRLLFWAKINVSLGEPSGTLTIRQKKKLLTIETIKIKIFFKYSLM